MSKATWNRVQILLTERLPRQNDIQKELADIASVVALEDKPDEDSLCKLVGSTNIIVPLFAKITRKVIESSQNLVAIVRYGTGVDNIDLNAATEKGVIVTCAPDYATISVAEHTITFILALSKKLLIADRLTRMGKLGQSWSVLPNDVLAVEVAGKTLGIIGFGRIGKEVAKRANALGMKVIAYDPLIDSNNIWKENVTPVDRLEELLPESDFISIHVPLNEMTYNLIGERELKMMKRSAFLINTSRGKIVNQTALIKALEEGWIAGSALDVYEKEPLDPDNPLTKLSNVILTPHSAWYTDAALERLKDTVVTQIKCILKNEKPPHIVNPEVYAYRKKFD
jgi:D-3-phosphoglycerate dehydrogenase / 2-oxoglutarate reductase